MRKLLMKAGIPLVAGGLVLSGIGVAGASVHPAKSVPTYKIAYEGPLSGGNAQLGLNMVYSVELAIAQWNAKKGDPFKLAIQKLDDQGDPTLAPTQAHLGVSSKATLAVVGPAFSGATAAAQAVYGPAHMPLVSPSATNPLLVTPAENPDHNFFRVVADDSVQGPADANYVVKKLAIKNVYVVNDGSTYGSGLAAQFNTTAHADGATTATNTADGTVGCTAGTGSDTEYAPLAATITGTSAKLVFYGGYYCDFAKLTAALRTAGYTGKLMSGDGSDDPHYVAETSPKSDANGAYLTCACAQLGTTKADKAFTTGFKHYSKGVAPGTYSPESYDAANTIILAMVNTLKAHKPLTRANIVAQLHKITYNGLTKKIHFLADGNISGSAIYANQVKNGVITQLGLE